MREKPQILNAEIRAKTRIFTVEAVDLRFSNGTEVQFERLIGSVQGAVLIVPMLDERTVLLTREYSAGVHRYELALPKGRIERGEDKLAAANREIMEEIGYGARKLEHITSLTLAPAYQSHHIHVILAQDLYPQRIPGDEPEEIEVVPWRIDNLSALIAHEECTEARSIAALYIVRDLLNGRAEGS